MAWTQPELARRGGPSAPTQSRIERGDAGIGAEALAAYATVYGVAYEDMRDYLSGRTEDMRDYLSGRTDLEF